MAHLQRPQFLDTPAMYISSLAPSKWTTENQQAPRSKVPVLFLGARACVCVCVFSARRVMMEKAFYDGWADAAAAAARAAAAAGQDS